MIQSAAAVIDVDALQRAPDADRAVIDLAWQEMLKPSNKQSKRDMWARVFGIRVMPFFSTDRTAVWPM